MLSHEFAPEILKPGDVRGIFNKELFPRDAYFAGRSFGTRMLRSGYSSCAVARDGRLSSDTLVSEAVSGLKDSGIDIINLGLIPSPALYYAVSHHEYQCGMMITASHNPAEYNGFKFLTEEGPFHGSDIQSLAEICRRADYTSGRGSISTRDILPDYVEYLISFLKPGKGKDLSVVWDPGNGAVGAVINQFVKKLPGKNHVICGDVDGTFPNHHPDPTIEENVAMLKDTLLRTGADIGIAFDGDGDRLGVLDSEGYLLYGDQLLAVFARDFLAEHPGASVMSEVKASRFFYEDVLAHGGNPIMWKVGHSNQKERMVAEGIGLAGETSGHIYFAENRNNDDGLFASIKLLNILSGNSMSLTDIRKGFPVYKDSGEIRIDVDAEKRARVLNEIEGRLTQEGREFSAVDGVRVSCGDGFWIVRCSNTQPHITIRAEAASSDGLDACLDEVRNQLNLSGLKDAV